MIAKLLNFLRLIFRRKPRVIYRRGARGIALPKDSGRVLNVTQYKDEMYIACENGVWRRRNNEWSKVEI